MIPKLGLVILVLGAAILLFWARGDRRGDRAAEPQTSGMAHTLEQAHLVAPPTPSETPPALRVEVTSRTAVDEATPTTETAPVPAVDRFRLRGTLLHSSDRHPAGGEELVFHFGDESTHVVTDAGGRFVTDAAVPRGAVRAWHMGANLPIEPETFLPEPRSNEELEEVVLVLVDPSAWLAIEVVAVNGAPVAAELLWHFHPGKVSETMRARSGKAPTDGLGRARLPFPGVDPGARLMLLARAAELVSDVILLQAPLPADPVQLVLDRGGSIRARVVVAGGEPLKDERLTLWSEDREMGLDDATSDAGGLATFSAVAPGRYRIDFWHDGTSQWIHAKVEVERGQTTEVDLEVPLLPLGVAGRVIDEAGLPLEGIRIVASFDDGVSTTTSTHGNGKFSVACLGSGSVRVSLEPEISGDRYQPTQIEVPFGTNDIVIRRLPAVPTSSLTLEIFDRNTLVRIPGAMVLGFVEPLRENWSFHHAPDGLAVLELKLYEDACLAVQAVGYRRRELRALDLVRAGPEGGPYRLLLEPGLQHALQIFDDESGKALLGALVFDGELLVATADGAGRARIELPTWPDELRIQAAGHADRVWTCKDWLAELGDGQVWLERVPADAAPPPR